jgi:hypothetical protein
MTSRKDRRHRERLEAWARRHGVDLRWDERTGKAVSAQWAGRRFGFSWDDAPRPSDPETPPAPAAAPTGGRTLLEEDLSRPAWAGAARSVGLAALVAGAIAGPAGLPWIAGLAIGAVAGIGAWRSEERRLARARSRPRRKPPREKPSQPYWVHLAFGMGLGTFIASILMQVANLDVFFSVAVGVFVALHTLTSRDAMLDLESEERARRTEADRKARETAPALEDQGSRPVENLALATVEADAAAGLARLRTASDRARAGEVRARLKRLAGIAERALDDLRTRPERAQATHRLFTYYLPRAADLGEAYAALEQRSVPEPDRLAEIEGFLAKMEEVFGQYADRVLETELMTLDAELRVLRQSLDEDLGRTRS